MGMKYFDEVNDRLPTFDRSHFKDGFEMIFDVVDSISMQGKA